MVILLTIFENLMEIIRFHNEKLMKIVGFLLLRR